MAPERANGRMVPAARRRGVLPFPACRNAVGGGLPETDTRPSLPATADRSGLDHPQQRTTRGHRDGDGTTEAGLRVDEQSRSIRVLSSAIVEWLAGEALQDSEPPALYGELCQRLRGVGMPILRGRVGFRILHPLYDAGTMNWTERTASLSSSIAPRIVAGTVPAEPDGSCLDHRLPVLRRRLPATPRFWNLKSWTSFARRRHRLCRVPGRLRPQRQQRHHLSWLSDRPTA